MSLKLKKKVTATMIVPVIQYWPNHNDQLINKSTCLLRRIYYETSDASGPQPPEATVVHMTCLQILTVQASWPKEILGPPLPVWHTRVHNVKTFNM